MKLNLPQTVTAADLARLAAPDEQFAVRVIFRRIANTGAYTIRGAKRRYVATRDPKLGAHCIDVPLSLWMHGVPATTYADNLSIAHDLQANRIPIKAPLVILVVPWKGAIERAAAPYKLGDNPASDPSISDPSPLEAFHKLAETMNAPEVILSAIELLASDLPADEKEAALIATTETVREQIAEGEQFLKQLGERHPDLPHAMTASEMTASEASHSASPPSEKPAPKTNAQRQKELRQRKKAEKEAAKLQTA